MNAKLLSPYIAYLELDEKVRRQVGMGNGKLAYLHGGQDVENKGKRLLGQDSHFDPSWSSDLLDTATVWHSSQSQLVAVSIKAIDTDTISMLRDKGYEPVNNPEWWVDHVEENHHLGDGDRVTV